MGIIKVKDRDENVHHLTAEPYIQKSSRSRSDYKCQNPALARKHKRSGFKVAEIL